MGAIILINLAGCLCPSFILCDNKPLNPADGVGDGRKTSHQYPLGPLLFPSVSPFQLPAERGAPCNPSVTEMMPVWVWESRLPPMVMNMNSRWNILKRNEWAKVRRNQVAILTYNTVCGYYNYSQFKNKSHKDGDDKKILGNCLENMAAQQQLVSLALLLAQL